jgi:sensor domain DACNV-containing protein
VEEEIENRPKLVFGSRQARTRVPKPVKTSFTLDPAFFSEMLARLNDERQSLNTAHRKRGDIFGLGGLLSGNGERYPASVVPSREHLARLVETAFWASLQREEDRPLKFSIGYESSRPAEGSDFLFGSSFPFEIGSLTKLGPATDGSNTTILVGPSASGNLEIQGISTLSLVALTIKVLDPGQLIVTFAGTNIAVISGAEAVHIRNPLFTRTSSMWAKFAPEGATDYSPWSDPRVDVLLDTVRRMRTLRHGGALIVVPDDDSWKKSVDLPITYSGKGKFTYGSEVIHYLLDLEKDGGAFSETARLGRAELDRVARTFAQLTAVDGATLITRELDVVGFGAKLKNASDAGEPPKIYKVDPLDHDEWFTPVELTKLGGMRHQSAARFVHNHHGSIAFVASQDGNVTAFVWQDAENSDSEGALHAYGRLELTLF